MLIDLLLVPYTVISWLLLLYALNFYYLFFRSLSGRYPPRTNNLYPLPKITIQLPIYNELYVARRLIDAVCQLDYPMDRLEIQILDDSTDVTKTICQEAAEEYRRKGFDIHLLTRKTRRSYKAGALQYGLERSTGEFIAIFDADFVPPKEFLHKALSYFSSQNIGLVQARWSHLNERSSWLARAEALELDLHFMVEQRARSMTELFLNFNGTAGLWRRKCIEDSGGWHENLAEDLDLSYRIQMKGWKIVFVHDILCKAELPLQVQAAMRQRYRWANGAAQCAQKFLPQILASDLAISTKVQAFFHLTRHFVYPLLIFQFILIPILMRAGYKLNPFGSIVLQLGVLAYILAIRSSYGRRWFEKLGSYFFLVLLSSGMAVTNIRAVANAISGKKAEFFRTPKFGIVGKEDWIGKSYALGFTKWVFLDIALAMYGVYTLIIAATVAKNPLFITHITLMILGFFYVALLTILHSRRTK